MVKKINLNDNLTFYGFESHKESLHNGEHGLGCSDDKKLILVTCCSNCGDYLWIDAEKLYTDLKRELEK